MSKEKINYLTSNALKFKIARNYFDSLDNYELVQYEFDTPEIQSESCEDIAKHAAVFAAQTLGEPCITLDVGFCINSLNGFPGPFIKYINNWLSEEDLIAMIDRCDDRSAYFLVATAIGYPDGLSKVFSQKYTGTIARRGEYKASSLPVNSLFIPHGYKIPLGLMSNLEQENYWGAGAWESVIQHLSARA